MSWVGVLSAAGEQRNAIANFFPAAFPSPVGKLVTLAPTVSTATHTPSDSVELTSG